MLLAFGCNPVMERVSDYTKELLIKLQRDGAWSSLDRNFDRSKPRRFISGIAVSSIEKNTNGTALDARGIEVVLPALLLLEHNYTYPLGKVTGVDVRGSEVRFRAEISNRSGPFWVDQVWPAIVSRDLTGVSVTSSNRRNKGSDGVWRFWCADEISIVNVGADHAARITRCWEHSPVVSLDPNKSSTIKHWSER